jgi:ubiquinone/menaquinone biosynthesis C-methylase UbiE
MSKIKFPDGSLEWHSKELDKARNADSRHLMPVIEARHRVVLDIGCGMGQTLIALNLPSESVGYGIDVDSEAIEAGKNVCPPNIHLSVSPGERLEFQDVFFDLIICRVALPYMQIDKTLREMFRVLRPGGEVWLALHPSSYIRKRATKALKAGKLSDPVYCGYVMLNGLLFNLTGKQLTVSGRTETVQSEGGIRRSLARAGFTSIKTSKKPFLIAEARKLRV